MKWLYATLFALFFGAPVQAQQATAPDVLVKNVTGEVLDIVRKDKDIQSGNNRKAIELIDAKVLPHFNFGHMAALAVARDWRQASAAQQKTLTEEFRTLLVRTYSKALSEYRNQTIDYKPFAMKPGETDVKVRTVVQQSGGKPVALDYYLEKVGSVWQVYDIEVSGVSLVTNYRGEFASEIRSGGIDGLIKALQDKNRTAGDNTAAAKQ
jgi:phospholipid transport system substrate-binding protein